MPTFVRRPGRRCVHASARFRGFRVSALATHGEIGQLLLCFLTKPVGFSRKWRSVSRKLSDSHEAVALVDGEAATLPKTIVSGSHSQAAGRPHDTPAVR